MSSAYQDKRGSGWIADFRPVFGAGTQRRRLRIPHGRILSEKTAAADAKAFADECETYCRLLEGDPQPSQLRHAHQIGAITQVQYDAIRHGVPMPTSGPHALEIPTLVQLAARHPSSIHEHTSQPGHARHHERQLEEFCEWSGIRAAEDLTLAKVQQWVAELKRKGLAWDTRRHYLILLRRAAKMATTIGLPDVLVGFRLDTSPATREIPTWSLAQLAKAAVHLRDKEPRALAVLALGGFMGLRCSEIQRLTIEDLDGDVVRIGVRERKNPQSRRDLPMPAIVAELIAPLRRERADEAPLIAGNSPRAKGVALHKASWAHWLTPVLATATGRKLPPKNLRSSFATFSIRHARLPADAVERFLGHQRSDVAAVTHRHYLAEARIAELRPHAEQLDQAIREELATAGWTFHTDFPHRKKAVARQGLRR